MIDRRPATRFDRLLRTVARGSLACVPFLAACGPQSGVAGDSAPGALGAPEVEFGSREDGAGDWRIDPEGDFVPGAWSRNYRLKNAGTEPLRWEVRVSAAWVAPTGPASGELLPGDTVEIPVAVDPAAVGACDAPTVVADLAIVDSIHESILARTTITVSTGFPGGQVLNVGSSGWTSFSPSADTRMAYVSSASGNDQNDGLSASTPKRTVAAGAALLRHGFPDWLLLERGGVWQETLGQWKKSGRSPTEPLLISTYGGAAARPLLLTGLSGGIWTSGSAGSPSTIDDLALVGVHFRPHGYVGGGDCIGAQFLQPGSHVLIEDCKFEGYSGNLVFQGYGGRHTDFKLRRSVIVDAYAINAIGGHSQGLYAYAVDGLLIEENVFDHNGWNEQVPGAGANMFSHNLYIDNGNTGVVLRGNLIANASSHGVQLRPGGTVVNNLFVRNSIALSVGGGNAPDAGGVTADVRGNVVLDGKNIDAANPRGWGLWFANIASGRVAYNVVANNTLGTQPCVLMLDGQHVGDTVASIGVHDLVIERNKLVDWGGSVLVKGNATQITNVAFTTNDVQTMNWAGALVEHTIAGSTAAFRSAANTFFSRLAPPTVWTEIANVSQSINYWFAQVGDSSSTSTHVFYVDPRRSLATYNGTLGGTPTVEAFLAEARLQSSTQWRSRLTTVSANRYIRGGF